MGAALVALPAFEVAVRRRSAALARLELVRVHGKTHGTAGLAPLEARLDEYLVEAFGLRLLFDDARARHDHGIDVVVHRLAVDGCRRRPQILDSPIGA